MFETSALHNEYHVVAPPLITADKQAPHNFLIATLTSALHFVYKSVYVIQSSTIIVYAAACLGPILLRWFLQYEQMQCLSHMHA